MLDKLSIIACVFTILNLISFIKAVLPGRGLSEPNEGHALSTIITAVAIIILVEIVTLYITFSGLANATLTDTSGINNVNGMAAEVDNFMGYFRMMFNPLVGKMALFGLLIALDLTCIAYTWMNTLSGYTVSFLAKIGLLLGTVVCGILIYNSFAAKPIEIFFISNILAMFQ